MTGRMGYRCTRARFGRYNSIFLNFWESFDWHLLKRLLKTEFHRLHYASEENSMI